jgi:hypothetical protein
MKKHILITLTIQDGERTHTHRCLSTSTAKNIMLTAQRFAASFYSDGGSRDNDWWWFGGEVAVCVENVIEISEYEYQLLTRLFAGIQSQNYFQVVRHEHDSELERDEIQIHAGDNGNVVLVNNGGVTVAIYGQNRQFQPIYVSEIDLSI